MCIIIVFTEFRQKQDIVIIVRLKLMYSKLNVCIFASKRETTFWLKVFILKTANCGNTTMNLPALISSQVIQAFKIRNYNKLVNSHFRRNINN